MTDQQRYQVSKCYTGQWAVDDKHTGHGTRLFNTKELADKYAKAQNDKESS